MRGGAGWNGRTVVVWRHATVAALWLAAALPATAAAQQGDCYPPCRAGFLCHQGQCVSACNPPCAASELCAPTGECVSRCNPACGPGQQCSPAGECVGGGAGQSGPHPPPGQVGQPPRGTDGHGWQQPPSGGYGQQRQAPPGYGGQPPPGQQQPPPGQQGWVSAGGQGQPPPGTPGAMPPGTAPGGASPGWARSASIVGFISAGVVGILTGVSIGMNEDDDDGGRVVGGVATAIFGATGIVTAIGGGSARKHPSVDGAPALRILSWIGYGLALVDAAFLIGISFEEDVESAHIASVGALGVLTLVGFAVDAMISAGEAESVGGGFAGPSIRPTFSLMAEREGGLAGVLGLSGEL